MNLGITKILGNWKVVLLSFLGATTFWFFSALGKEYNYRITHPIKFVYNKDSLVAVKPLPEFIDMDVSGGGWDLFRETFWFVDLVMIELDNPVDTKYLTKPYIMSIVSDQLKEYRINFLYTDTLYIDIDRKTSKLVSLKIDSIQIDMDSDYRIVSPVSLLPDTVLIYGPTSFLDTIGNNFYVTLDEEEIDESFDEFVEIGLPDILEIRSEPSTINIKFDVARFDQLELNTVVEVQNFPGDSSVYVNDRNIVIRYVVPHKLQKEYLAEDFKVIVDYDLINKSDSTALAIVIFYPDPVIEVETIPNSLSITYEK